MKTPNSKLEYCEKVFIAVSHNNQNYNKGLKYFTYHVMSLFNILFSPFKFNYWNKCTFAQYSNFSPVF